MHFSYMQRRLVSPSSCCIAKSLALARMTWKPCAVGALIGHNSATEHFGEEHIANSKARQMLLVIAV